LIHKELMAHDVDVCRSKVLDLRYVDASLTEAILPSYKKTSRGEILRRLKKKDKVHGCIKSAGKL